MCPNVFFPSPMHWLTASHTGAGARAADAVEDRGGLRPEPREAPPGALLIDPPGGGVGASAQSAVGRRGGEGRGGEKKA